MIRPTAVEPREGFRIWLRYSDGVSGELNLSHLAGRGVFAAWDEPGCFERACTSRRTGPSPGATSWSCAPTRSTWT